MLLILHSLSEFLMLSSFQTVHPHPTFGKLEGEVLGSHQRLEMTLQGWYSHLCAVFSSFIV